MRLVPPPRTGGDDDMTVASRRSDPRHGGRTRSADGGAPTGTRAGAGGAGVPEPDTAPAIRRRAPAGRARGVDVGTPAG
ncbi:hypothetical protein, partial [Nonomuraea aridisoli]|uniref:hypothetical protein n=1 Tax=Nonomuraea aridisoli TaxID=2070368 RepID=UPI001C6548E4